MLKQIIKKILNKLMYGKKVDSESYVKYLKSLGVRIGEESKIYSPYKSLIDITRPWLINIGDNVFIGMKSTILKGVTIGDNVIIGANSLVNKDIPSNSVAVGNPCRVVSSIDEYYNKRKKVQLDEAVELTLEYYKTYNKWPEKNILREFIWLFENRENNVDNNDVFKEIASLNGNYEMTKENFYKSKGSFNSYEEFIEFCKDRLC